MYHINTTTTTTTKSISRHHFLLFLAIAFLIVFLHVSYVEAQNCNNRGDLVGSPPKCQCDPGYKPFTQNDCSKTCSGGGGVCCKGYYCPGDGKQYGCAPGTYSDEGWSACQDCDPGHWCSAFSDSATQNQCEAGSWAAAGTPYGCTFCDAGYYCDAGSDSPQQHACAPGTYSVGGASSCQDCDAGYYCTGASTTSVQFACPGGTYSTSGSSSCTNCTAGYYCLDASPSSTQFACPPGYWSSGGSAECAKCSAGYYCPSSSSTSPTAQICPAGFYSDEGAVFCEVCDAGYACPNPGTTTPTDVLCSAGTYSQGGAATCSPCSAGYYCDVGSPSPVQHECPAGTYSTDGSSGCTNCTAGYYCSSASDSPTQNACPPGYWSAEGSSECKKCSAGYSCPSSGSTSPTENLCPDGKWAFSGSGSCYDCFAGFYCPAGSVSPTVNKCPPGTYSYAGASECTNCTAGYYCSSASSSPTQNTCPPGYWSAEGASECVECPPGYECPTIATTDPIASPCSPGKYCGTHCAACTNCPEGYACPSNATTDADRYDYPCPDGSYSTAGSDSCSPCAAGFYCTSPASTPYQNICPAGSWSAEGSSSCGACEAGFKCDSGSTQPNSTACFSGSWSAPGSASCSLCPPGYECPNSETSNPTENPCPAGTYCAQGCTSCTSCAPGYHCKPQSSSSAEYICPAGYYCPAGTEYPGTSHPCPTGYTGEVGSSKASQCNLAICFGIVQTNTSHVCSGRGTCTDPDTCVCSGSWTGAECDVPICFGESGANACNYPNGTCAGPDSCSCVSGWSGVECKKHSCYGTPYDVSSVCSGHGTCLKPNDCVCEDNYGGPDCSSFLCYGIYAASPSVCSGHGVCGAPNNCTCDTGYLGAQCDGYTCHDVMYYSPSVCSGHGSCMSYDNCSCTDPYFGAQCQDFMCYGIERNNNASVCSGHGTCSSPNTCSCDSNYISYDCSSHLCYGVNASAPSVCSSKGVCVDVDTCVCPADRFGEQCQYTYANPPTTILKAPQDIGPCDELLLDGSFSYSIFSSGSLQYHWDIVSAPSNFTHLQQFVRPQLDMSALIIPVSYLSSSGVYTFSLYVNDSRHIPGAVKQVSVTKRAQVSPQLVIEGFNEYTITRSQALDLRGTLQLTGGQCGTTASLDDLNVSYVWSQTSGPSVSFQSTKNVASLAAYTFPLGENSYTFQLTGTVLSSGASTTAVVTVHVKHGDLVPLIAGGDRTISRSIDFQLDGSSSYDPDRDSTPSQYLWTCVTCSNQFIFFTQQGKPKITVPANTFSSGVTHTMKLQYSKGSRNSTTTVDLKFIETNAPQVSVFGGGTVNRNQRLVLNASVDLSYFTGSESDIQSYWTSDDIDLSASILIERADQKTRRELALKENILEVGKTYIFSYRVVTKDSIVSASTQVTVNSPPRNGRFDVSPLSGIQYQTVFSLVAPAWIDEQLPLQYMFEYALVSDPSTWYTIQAFSSRSTSQFIPIRSGGINLRMRIRDGLGAETFLQKSITVAASSIGSSSQALQNIWSIAKLNDTAVENDDIALHRIQSSFQLLNENNPCSGDAASCATLQDLALDRLSDYSSTLSHSENPSDTQVSNLVNALAEVSKSVTESTLIQSTSSEENTWRILNTSICSFPNMKFSDQSVYSKIVSTVDQQWKLDLSKGSALGKFPRVQQILRCVANSVYMQKVNGEQGTVIDEDNFGVQVFKDILSYLRNEASSVVTSSHGKVKLSNSLGSGLEETVPVALTVLRYKQNPVESSSDVTPLSSVVDMNFYNADSGESVHISNLPEKEPNQITFFNVQPASSGKLECRYWNEDTLQWTTEGVSTASIDGSTVTCEATHASLFSVVEAADSSTPAPTPTPSDDTAVRYAMQIGIPVVAAGALLYVCLSLCICCALICCCFVCIRRRSKKKSVEEDDFEALQTNDTETPTPHASMDAVLPFDIDQMELDEWRRKAAEASEEAERSNARLDDIRQRINDLESTNDHLLKEIKESRRTGRNTETTDATLRNKLAKEQLRVSNRRLLLKTFELMSHQQQQHNTAEKVTFQQLGEKQRVIDSLRKELRTHQSDVNEMQREMVEAQQQQTTTGEQRIRQMMRDERQGAQHAIRSLQVQRDRLLDILEKKKRGD